MKYLIVVIVMFVMVGCGDYNQIAITNNNQIQKVNINTATKEELMKFSGIGEKKAQSIIDNRPYADIYEIQSKTKVGDKVFNNIKKGLKCQ